MSTEATNSPAPVEASEAAAVEGASSVEGSAAPNADNASKEQLEALQEADPNAVVTVTINGEKHRITVADAIRNYSTGRASQQRFQEAAKLRKEAEAAQAQVKELLELAQSPEGFLAVMEYLNVDAKKLKSIIDKELSTPEDVKRIRDIERREKAIRDYEESKKKEAQEAKLAKAEAEARQKYLTDISTGLESVGLPKNERMVAAVAQVLIDASRAGEDLSVKDACEIVYDDLMELRKQAPATQQKQVNSTLSPAKETAAAPKTQKKQTKPKRRIHSANLTPEEYKKILDGEM